MHRAERPNVVLIVTDQQRYDSMGCTGNPHALTPNLDALAREGTLCRRFISANAVCMPTRASMVTGLYPSAHGVWGNGVPLARRGYVRETDSSGGALRPGQPPVSHFATLADAFAQAGYRTASVGKLHLTPTQSHPSLGFEESRARWAEDPAMDDWHGPYFGFQHVEMSIGHGDHLSGHYGRWLERQFPEVARRSRQDARERPFKGVQLFRSVLPVEAHHSTWCAERACEYVRRAGQAGEPFLLWVGFPDPHHPFAPPQELAEQFEKRPAADPACPAGAWEDKPAGFRHYLREGSGWRCTPEALRRVRQYTDAMVHLIDRGVGRIVQALREGGLSERTVVVFTSDHGDFLGDYGLIYKINHTCMALNRVPFIISAPGAGLPAEVAAPLGTPDLLPTLCRLAGLEAPEGCQGEAMQDVLARGRRDLVMCQEFPNDPTWRGLSVLDERYRFTWYPGTGEQELYDHAEDPHEKRNLTAGGDAPAEAGRLMAALREQFCRMSVPASGRVAIW